MRALSAFGSGSQALVLTRKSAVRMISFWRQKVPHIKAKCHNQQLSLFVALRNPYKIEFQNYKKLFFVSKIDVR